MSDTAITTRRYGRSFYWSSLLLRGDALASSYALYAFFRRLDDWFDEGGGTAASMDLARKVVESVIVRRLSPVSAQGCWSHDELLALHAAVLRHDLPAGPFFAMLEGMEMDQAEHRYETDAEVDHYCYCVAGSVGELMALVFDARSALAQQAAIALGKAMQRTNILRDIGEDLGRGRVYIAAQTLRAHGIESLGECEPSSAAFESLMQAEIERARGLYSKAEAGFASIGAWSFRCCVMLMAALYGAILGRIKHQRYDVFSRRAVVPGWHKLLWLMLVAFVRLPRSLLFPPAAESKRVHLPRAAEKRVAVIGGGFAGLSAAALLAKRGFSVDLFEQQSSVGGKAQTVRGGGVTLDLGPTLLTMPSIARDLFKELGAEDLMPRLHTLQEQCAYRFADGRMFSAHAELERLAAAAEEFGRSEAEGVRSFYGEAEAIYRAAGEPFLSAPFGGMMDYGMRVAARGLGALQLGLGMSTLHSLACRHFKSPQMRQFIGRFATYVGGSPFEMSAAYAMIAHLERSQGVHHVEGGMGALAGALGAAAERVGVRIHLGTSAVAERSSGKFMVRHAGELDAFDEVVLNADPLDQAAPSATRLSMSGHVLALSVPRRLALAHHTVLFSSDYAKEFAFIGRGQVPTDPTVYLCHPAASDSSMAEPTRSGLFVMINAAPVGVDYPVELSRQTIFSALERAGVDVSSCSIIAERTPASFARLGSPQGAIYGALGHGRLGPFLRPKARGRDGRWFAGGGTHPGGGVPMVLLSGRFAADGIASAARGGRIA